MILEKKSVRFMAKYALVFSIISIIAGIFNLYFMITEIFITNSNTMIILFSFIWFAMCLYVIYRDCFITIYKVVEEDEMVAFYALFKTYKFNKNESAVMYDKYRYFSLKIKNKKIIFNKHWNFNLVYNKEEVDQIVKLFTK